MPARTRLRAATASITLVLMGARHPMHTAVAEIALAAGSPVAEIRIRVFADDFGTVVPATRGAADSAMSRYVRGHFAVADRSGRPAAVRWTGGRREGDVVLLLLTVPVAGGLAGARVQSTLLCERFEDQVNIVRATYDGRSTTLLFTPGDAPKVLP